jgi:urease accessory protein
MMAAVDGRDASVVGRAARLELVFEARGGRTVVVHSYAEPPFRIGRSFDIDGAAYVILVCSGPGIFAGDALHLSIRVGAGARVMLTSQAALQVHPAGSPSPAIVRHEYLVEDEGELHAHWDPVIPFADARLDQRFELQIAENSRLYWSDALMSGRVSRAEAWRFDSLAHELHMRVGPTLKYLERYRLAPHERSVTHPWIAGGTHYAATAVVYHECATVDTAESLQREIDADAGEGVRAGVDHVDDRLVVSRLLGTCGAPFSAARASYRRLVLGSIFGRPHQLLRK